MRWSCGVRRWVSSEDSSSKSGRLPRRRACTMGLVAASVSRPCLGPGWGWGSAAGGTRSEEHTSELQSLMRISYAVFCLKQKKRKNKRKMVEDKMRYNV